MQLNPIIALWCHPRSMSTAVERVMRERGDLVCFHEPFMHYYYGFLGRRAMPHANLDPANAMDFAAIVERLHAAARSAPVFFKDMSYYVAPASTPEQADFARLSSFSSFSSQVHNLFLVREPRRALLSYYQLDPNVTLEEVGLEAQWRHADWLHRTTGNTPLVLEAEAIAQDPVASLGALFRAVSLGPAPHAFHWQPAQTPADWQQVAGWHESVSRSHGITTPKVEDDAALRVRFDAAAMAAPQLADYLAHHQPFYQRLKEMARSCRRN